MYKVLRSIQKFIYTHECKRNDNDMTIDSLNSYVFKDAFPSLRFFNSNLPQ